MIRSAQIAATVLALSFPLRAADSTTLTNSGEPMRVTFACAPEDLEYAGMNCDENNPCPVYLEINSAAGNGEKIVAAGDLHTGSVTLASVILMSVDGGATWSEPSARLPGSAFDQLQFLDAEHVWAAGEVQYPLSRDPFFLLSTDGGRFWRQAPIGDEGGGGAVQSFRFDSPKHGELIVEAGREYTLYESQTGGESWTTREKVHELPKLRSAAPEPAVRVQMSKDGKAWRVERRSGVEWRPAGSFLVDSAVCGKPTGGDGQ